MLITGKASHRFGSGRSAFSALPQPAFKFSMPDVHFRAYTTSSFEDHPAFVRSFRFQHLPDVQNARQTFDFSSV
jgi:hypothetical protein